MIQNVLTCAALFYAATFIDRTGAAAYLLWRISHRKHHSNTGSCKIDEVFVPMTRFVLASSWNETLEDSPLYQLYRIAFMLVVGWMTGYLFVNATGPTKYWVAEPLQPELGHLRRPQEEVYAMVKLYVVPYFTMNAYLVLITYLQLSFKPF
ncbi:hypothetical protein PF002_g30703 [Phytophthora fragariae]|uniref:Fatty acid desaturase domain-containing protein n=1 Tax=Phytophthora fragariae TaxID=53985 RepID=A0A6A3VV52_9STRA|nr:hypothetical protein PF002_g30703 [Phytophthora fragariae]